MNVCCIIAIYALAIYGCACLCALKIHRDTQIYRGILGFNMANGDSVDWRWWCVLGWVRGWRWRWGWCWLLAVDSCCWLLLLLLLLLLLFLLHWFGLSVARAFLSRYVCHISTLYICTQIHTCLSECPCQCMYQNTFTHLPNKAC